MELLSVLEGISVLLTFALAMIGLVYWSSRKRKAGLETFLVADRNVSWIRGALSIAVSWIWAPAIFIASLQAYTQGLAGAFWFIAPNILCFFVFAPVAVRIRKQLPDGYTLPQYMMKRFEGAKSIHLSFLFIYAGYQLGAIVINCLAGGLLLHTLTGLSVHVAILSLSTIALLYSLMSGLRASILSDILQMGLLLIVALILVPWVIFEAGGLETLNSGLGGISGDFGNILDPSVAYAFGIAMTFGLISGPIADQMFFQRAFAVKAKDIKKTFVFGGLFFGVIPILLASLGFIAASPEVSSVIQVSDPQMVAPLVIQHFLPKAALLLFLFMAFAGLCSTLDSAYCAVSSLTCVDGYRRYFNPNASDASLLRAARAGMIAAAVLGTGLALLQPKLLWVFLIYGALASVAFAPTVFSIFNSKISRRAVSLSLKLSLLLGFPFSVYANVTENTDLIVASSVTSILIGVTVCSISLLLSTAREKRSSSTKSALAVSLQRKRQLP